MMQNAYLLAQIGADTAENERNFTRNLEKNGNYPTGPPAQVDRNLRFARALGMRSRWELIFVRGKGAREDVRSVNMRSKYQTYRVDNKDNS